MEASQRETPDISVFRYYFWEPVLQGPAQQPHCKCLKERFAGVAWNTRDTMTYVIYLDRESELGKQPVHHSVIIPRLPDKLQPEEKMNYPSDYFRVDPKAPVLAGRKRTPTEISTKSSQGNLSETTTKEPV